MVDSSHFFKSTGTGREVRRSDNEEIITIHNSIEDQKVKRGKDSEREMFQIFS